MAGFGFTGVYVDANAVSPQTAREMASAIEKRGGRYVDGGIVGSPPREGVPTRLYLSGPMAPAVAELFRDTVVQARVVSDEAGSASAVKMAYAAWSKGAAAMLIAIRALARAEDVEAITVGGVARVRSRAARAFSPSSAVRRPEGMAIRG